MWRQTRDEIAEVEIAVDTVQHPQVNEATDNFDWPQTIPMPRPDMMAIARASLRRRRYTPPEVQLSLFG